MDLARFSGRVAARSERLTVDAFALTTLPWVSAVVGEVGHSHRELDIHASAFPANNQRLRMAAGVRMERSPYGGWLGAGGMSLGEAWGSSIWEAVWGRGVLGLRGGLSASRALFQAPGTPGSTLLRLNQRRSRLAVGLVRPVGETWQVSAGLDRLGYQWSGDVNGGIAVTGVYGETEYMRSDRFSVRLGGRLDRMSGGNLALAPRGQVDWHVGSRTHLSLGGGVYHQAFMGSVDRGERKTQARMASGTHSRLLVDVAIDTSMRLRLDSYAKRLIGLPASRGPVQVVGGTLGLMVPSGAGGGVFFGLGMERRMELGEGSWSPRALASLDGALDGSTRVRVNAGIMGNLGGVPTSFNTDSATVSLGAEGLSSAPWSVRADLEVSRLVVQGHDVAIRAYAQARNLLGTEWRPAFTSRADGTDPHAPRVLLLGVAVGTVPP